MYRVAAECLVSAYTSVFNGWNLFLCDMGLVGSEEAAREARARAFYAPLVALVVTQNRGGENATKTTYRANMVAKLPGGW